MENNERPSVRTQFLIFTLFGDYILPREGTVWTSNLLNLLNLLGVSERAARSTLSRMARKGWLVSSKKGRRSRYSLTARGWKLLKQGEQRIFEPPFADWDGLWNLVVYSLPEKKRHLRHSLRQNLIWLGFGHLSPGTWVSPHNRKLEVENACNELGIREYVQLFTGMHLGLSSDEEMVRRCWDLPGLAAQYQEFIDSYQKDFRECLAQGNGNITLAPEECFVRRFWLTHTFQSFPLIDPNLPTILLPDDWIGLKARQLFDDYRRLLEFHANQFVEAVLMGEKLEKSEAPVIQQQPASPDEDEGKVSQSKARSS